MTSLTILLGVVLLLGALLPAGYPRALAIAGATPVGAAIVIGAVEVPTFYAAALGVPVALAFGVVERTRTRNKAERAHIPGLVPLALFTMWSIVVTLAAPQFFAGQAIYSGSGRDDVIRAGLPTSSNIAQIAYLLLGLCIVIFLARHSGAPATIIGLTTGLVTLLNLWAYLGSISPLPFPTGFFDNSTGYAFIESAQDGSVRFRGILSEPAGVAATSVVTMAYAVSRAAQVAGARRLGLWCLTATAAFLGLVSTSATFVVVTVVLMALALALGVFRVVLRAGRLDPLAATLACIATVAAMWFVPVAARFVSTVVDDKVSSSSYEARSGADQRSFEILRDTFGLGLGLGTHRPSSIFATLLSSTGLVGTVLFACVLVTVLTVGVRSRSHRPVAWALVASIVTKLVSGPDLSDTSGLMWLSIGLLAGAGVKSREQRMRNDAGGESTGGLEGRPLPESPSRQAVSYVVDHDAHRRHPHSGKDVEGG